MGGLTTRGVGRPAWLLVLVGLLTLGQGALPDVAAAQKPPTPTSEMTIQRLRIQVLPEFDDPRVLVVVQGRLGGVDGELELPARVTFRVPRGAQINQMAAMDMGTMTAKPYDTEPDPEDGRWSLVTYTVDDAHFFYEYYTDPFEPGADPGERRFTFAFDSPQAVADLSLTVQEPRGATGFALDPEATETHLDDMGFTAHEIDVGALRANEDVAVTVSYTKTDPAPSVSREDVMRMEMGSSEAGATADGVPSSAAAAIPRGNGGNGVWPVVLVGGASIAIFSALRYRSQPAAGPEEPGLQKAGLQKAGLQNRHQPAAERRGAKDRCRQCGAAPMPPARFCHVCGAPRGGTTRRETGTLVGPRPTEER